MTVRLLNVACPVTPKVPPIVALLATYAEYKLTSSLFIVIFATGVAVLLAAP